MSFRFYFCLTLILSQNTLPLFCKLLLWKALQEIFYETFFGISSKTYSLKKYIINMLCSQLYFTLFTAQHDSVTCVDASIVWNTAVHWSKPVRAFIVSLLGRPKPQPLRYLWLDFWEEACSLPTSDFKVICFMMDWSPCMFHTRLLVAPKQGLSRGES